MDELANEAALHRIASRLLRDAADQDDAIQEMWLASLEESSASHREEAGWRVKTLRHRAMRIWDRKRRRAAAEAEAAPLQPLPDPAEELDRHSIRELLQETMGLLPHDQAQVIRLRFFEDQSPKEIARRLGSPAATIRARLARGLAEMRRRLDTRTGDARLTALALIRGFDLRPDDKTLLASSAGASGPLVALGIFTSLAVVVLLGWFFLSGGESSSGGSPEPGLVAQATEPEGPDPASPRATEEREPIAADAEAEEATAPASPAEEETAEPETPLAADEMRVTFRGLDESGAPVSGFHAKAWLPADRGRPLVGPAGEEGVLSFVVTEEYLWEYDQELMARFKDTVAEAVLQEGTFVKFSVTCPGTVRRPDLHVPFVPGSEHELEVRFDFQPGEVSGRVVDPNGNPVADVLIRSETGIGQNEGGLALYLDELMRGQAVMGPGEDGEAPHLGYCLRTSGEDGQFLFDGLPAGRVTFWLYKEGFAPMVLQWRTIPGERIEHTFELMSAVPVVGTVYDPNGKPVEGARILTDWTRSRPEMWVHTAADGSFTFASLPPGWQRLWAYGPAGTPLENHTASELVLLERDEVEWAPILRPGLELTLEVVDAEGDPVPGQSVMFRVEGHYEVSQWWTAAVTDAEGRITVNKLPDFPICAELRVAEGIGTQTMSPVPFRSLCGLRPRAKPYRMQLGADDRNLGRVRGSIVFPDGTPCADANIMIQVSSYDGLGSCPHQEGRFEIENLPAGECLLLVGRTHKGYWSKRFHLAPGQDLDLGELWLPEYGTLWVFNGWPSSDMDDRRLYGELRVIVPGLNGPLTLVTGLMREPVEGEFMMYPGEVQVAVCVLGVDIDQRTTTVRSGEVADVELIPSVDLKKGAKFQVGDR